MEFVVSRPLNAAQGSRCAVQHPVAPRVNAEETLSKATMPVDTPVLVITIYMIIHMYPNIGKFILNILLQYLYIKENLTFSIVATV